MMTPQYTFRHLAVVGLCCAGLGASAFVLPVTKSTANNRQATTTSLDATALIVQNKGGGHGELGK